MSVSTLFIVCREYKREATVAVQITNQLSTQFEGLKMWFPHKGHQDSQPELAPSPFVGQEICFVRYVMEF